MHKKPVTGMHINNDVETMIPAKPEQLADLLTDPDYYHYQLNRIRPQVKILGSLASGMLLLMLPWDFQSDSPDRSLAMAMRMVAILQLYLIAIVWQKQWLEHHFVPALMGLGLVSFLFLCANYILLPERTEYLFTILYYYNLAFLVLAPLATTAHILLTFFVPTLLVYAMLFYVGQLQNYFVGFTLHTIPLLLILNMGAWYIRKTAQDHYRLYRENVELASHDALTGLFNRRAWENRSQNLLARAKREQGRFAVIITDLDYFKNINDNFGHLVGDEVLKQLAICLQRTVRDYDVLGRYGGEEFIISVTGMDQDQVRALGERLRAAVERMKFTLPNGAGISMTMSVGIASMKDGSTLLDALMDQSDKALYRAKQKGRNRVEVFENGASSAPVSADFFTPGQVFSG